MIFFLLIILRVTHVSHALQSIDGPTICTVPFWALDRKFNDIVSLMGPCLLFTFPSWPQGCRLPIVIGISIPGFVNWIRLTGWLRFRNQESVTIQRNGSIISFLCLRKAWRLHKIIVYQIKYVKVGNKCIRAN